MNTYLRDLAERVLFTAAQAALAVVMVTGFDFFDTEDLTLAGKAAVVAAALALLKGIVARGFGGDPGSASLVNLKSVTTEPQG